jgi:hypothetical protein
MTCFVCFYVAVISNLESSVTSFPFSYQIQALILALWRNVFRLVNETRDAVSWFLVAAALSPRHLRRGFRLWTEEKATGYGE